MSRPTLVALVVAAAAGTGCAHVIIPTDAAPTCAVDKPTFDSWFDGGTAKAGGLVKAADGFDFPPPDQNNDCDFYSWGAQMFLWLTSPLGSEHVFDSSMFYDVVATGHQEFSFVPSGGGGANALAVRTVKPEEIGGTGQAGGGDVLISQRGSLVYYGIHANDIYAWYHSGYGAGAFSGPMASEFPTTETDVDAIAAYAKMSFADKNASTMELKTSWVDAGTVDASRFVVISAQVPAFEKHSDTQWTANGTEVKELAMVGMHIAAPVLGHPELVWISYEHLANAPMAEYQYNTRLSRTTVPYDSSGTWTFLPTGASIPATITSVATSTGGDIVAAGGATIGASDSVQKNPWGSAPGAADKIDSNTDLVSLNASLIAMLARMDDVRGNYYQLGGIWTASGQLPDGDGDDDIRGGDRLANSTLETFHQDQDENNGSRTRNCFSCHNVPTGEGVGISHIFEKLKPLRN